MLSEVVTAWNTICWLFQGFYALLVPCAKFFFYPEILPFTILGIIGILVKHRRR